MQYNVFMKNLLKNKEKGESKMYRENVYYIEED